MELFLITIQVMLFYRSVLSFSSRRSALQRLAPEENVFPPWEVNGGNITSVEISLEISQIRSVMFDAEMTFELFQTWYDPRFVNTSRQEGDFTLFKSSDFELLWRPDTYIANELPNGVFETTPTDYVKAFPNGSLFQNTRHSIIFYCNVKLFAIPDKDEICGLKLRSASYSTDVMLLIWKSTESVKIVQDMQTFAVKITKIETVTCTEHFDDHASAPCLELKLHLQRIHKVIVIQVFLPSTCILFITWLGFWIHHTEVSGRTRISVVCFTAIIAESIAVMIINPDQLHVEAIQTWNAGCIILITAAFLEFVIVHNIHRKREAERTATRKMKFEDEADSRPQLAGTSTDDNLEVQKNKRVRIFSRRTCQVSPENTHEQSLGELGWKEKREKKRNNQLKPETIDRVAAILFVVLFLAFNAFYWSYFHIRS